MGGVPRSFAILRPQWRARAHAGYTLADQGVVSLLNFLTTVAVGQFSGADELGPYILAFTVVTLVAVSCDAFVGTPYMTQHPHMREDRRRAYAGSIAVQQAALAAVAAVCLATAALAISAAMLDGRAARILIVLALTVPAVLAREFARRISLAHLQPGHALTIDAAAAFMQLSAIAALAGTGTLSAVTALGAIGLSSILAAGSWLLFARPSMAFDRAAIREDFLRSRNEGLWTCAALATFLVHIFAASWALAFLSTADQVGLFAACQTLVMISNPLVTGLANIVMPRAAHAYAKAGPAGVRSTAVRSVVPLAVSMTLMSAPLVVFGGAILPLIYGSAFAGLGGTVALLATACAIRAAGVSPYIGLWALGRSHSNFTVNLGGITVTMLTLPWLFMHFGIVGAAAAVLLGDVAAAAARWILFLWVSGPEGSECRA